MHNPAFERLGLDYCYVALPVRPEALAQAVAGLRALNFAGANVTVPHKENVIPLLDAVDEEAAFIGAVNTVVNRGGKLAGYNTDGRGFMRGLSEEGVDPAGRDVLVVGTGGAARAIGYYLAKAASRLFLFDIDAAKAERLAGDLGGLRGNVERLPSLGRLQEMGVVVNATPLGLHAADPLPFDPAVLAGDAVVVELIYRETALQRAARARGLKVVNGLGMLLWQGVLAFELWTGAAPPHGLMREALLEALGQ
jgi:shikimate dehydrogenase